MRLNRPNYFARLVRANFAAFVAALSALVATPYCEAGQTTSASSVEKTSIGFGSNVRLGHWVPVSFHFNPDANVRPKRFEISCPDGDGAQVTYQGSLKFDKQYPNVGQACIRMGRDNSRIAIKLFAGNELVDEFGLSANKDFSVLPSTQKMILTIEPTDRLAATLDNAISGLKYKPVVVHAGDVSELPLEKRCYRGINQLILIANNTEQVEAIGTERLDVIIRWLEDGGHLILGVGQGGDQLLGTGQPLNQLSPGTFSNVVKLTSSRAIEFFAGSKNQLLPDDGIEFIPATKITDFKGMLVLTDDDIPLILEQSIGLGRLTFVGVDLDSDLINAWSGNANFVRKILMDNEESSAGQIQAGNRVSHYGYDDLTGQLRVPLDQFSRARMISFTWVAVLIALFILCIGPGDYFLLRKLIGRMELTWITFGLMTVGFCAIAWFTVESTKPKRIQLNQLEVIDIDAAGGTVKGTVWANLFSPKSEKLDLDLQSSGDEFGFVIDASEISWHGLPGNGLGGMRTSAATAITGEQYDIAIDPDSRTRTRIEGLPMRVSSSKSVFAIWSGKAPTNPNSRLKYNPRNQQLEGTLTNPMDKPLANLRILFGDSVYVLGRPLEPGETIDISRETREKFARSHFNRQTSKENKSSNTPWNPTDTRINRIADMMLFYEAAGGRGYTGLSHDYQAFVDLSHIPKLNRAILVGEFKERVTDITINGEPPSNENYDHQLTIMRIVLPVAGPPRRKNTSD